MTETNGYVLYNDNKRIAVSVSYREITRNGVTDVRGRLTPKGSHHPMDFLADDTVLELSDGRKCKIIFTDSNVKPSYTTATFIRSGEWF